MRMYPREFPATRRKDPKRLAERRVYEALAGRDHRGFVYIELDFAGWGNWSVSPCRSRAVTMDWSMASGT